MRHTDSEDPEHPPRGRTRAHVQREYGEQKWPEIEALIEAELRAEPDADLACMLGRLGRRMRQASDPLTPEPFVLGGRRMDVPISSVFGAAMAVVAEVVIDSCTDRTDLLIELGAGWGRPLFSAWVAGAPRSARLVAAEYTESGRRAARKLAALDPILDFEAVAFDYYEPRLQGLGPSKHAVVFTAHSIEQIPHVPPALFEAIGGVAEQVTCVHFEPVGWQRQGAVSDTSSRAYAERHGYNENLLAALEPEAAAGRIQVDQVRPDIFGVNPENSTTVVRWQTRTRGSTA